MPSLSHESENCLQIARPFIDAFEAFDMRDHTLVNFGKNLNPSAVLSAHLPYCSAPNPAVKGGVQFDGN